MLNLLNPVSYTDEEQEFINSTLKPLESDGWLKADNKTKGIKNKISRYTIENQFIRCAYCESILRAGDAEIEHIAPKGQHGIFCFEPYNLITTCSVCNSPRNKGTKDTIVAPVNVRYVDNNFTIVHPYINNPDDHLSYVDPDRIVFDKEHCTQLGIDTIAFFNWEETSAIVSRRINALVRDLPLEIVQLVDEISTYKT